MALEFEVTLRICSEDPEGVFRDIVMTSSIGSYELIYRDCFSIHDRYFDTPQGTLAGKGYALRLRTEGKRRILGLKGNERVNEWGGIERTEIEGPWSKENIAQALQAVSAIPFIEEAFDPDDPMKTLSHLGLGVIQSRETKRTLLDVVFSDSQTHPVIGVMALDRVCYEAGKKNYLHYEIEVEAGEGKDRIYLGEFVDSLKDTFPGDLCRWDHNKLITGRALEALIEQGDLSPASRTGDLIPLEWYDAIESWIRKNRERSGK
jgi:hypothetical protein